jgi:flavodoxin
MMNALVGYYSLYGNTKQVAEAVAEGLAPAGQARTVRLEELTPADLAGADLVVMGSPTHYQNLPKAVRPFLEALPRKSLAGKRVASFDTSREMWRPLRLMTAAHRLLPRLRRLGGKSVVPPETFLVTKGHETATLYDGELERARAWAGRILQRMQPRS